MIRPVEGRSAIGIRGRVARAIAVGGSATLGLAFIAPSAGALTINVYQAGFTAAEQARITEAVNFYQTTFSDPITVNIGIQAITSGLGQSQTYVDTPTYATYKSHLLGDETSADDATAYASLGGSTATDPEGISSNITLKTANARAVGISDAFSGGGASSALFCNGIPGLPAIIDGCIGINTTLTSATPNTSGAYYFLTVLEHEMDEVLGLGSDLEGNGSNFTPNLAAQDLFRYSAAGTRTFAHHTCVGGVGPLAYFSIDGGVTQANSFNNCTNGGDYGDFVFGDSPPQVQDAFGTAGLGVSLTSSSGEIQELDVIGYTRTTGVVATPEPATLTMLATGFVGLAGFARRRKTVAK
jgi:hypothetical protein